MCGVRIDKEDGATENDVDLNTKLWWEIINMRDEKSDALETMEHIGDMHHKES